jgi:hypothetical protein
MFSLFLKPTNDFGRVHLILYCLRLASAIGLRFIARPDRYIVWRRMSVAAHEPVAGAAVIAKVEECATDGQNGTAVSDGSQSGGTSDPSFKKRKYPKKVHNVGRPPSRAKKTAHNAIERKYRNSINDKIDELKACLPLEMVPPTKSRSSKSAVLASALVYIQKLESNNTELSKENHALRGKRVGPYPSPPSSPGRKGSAGPGMSLLVSAISMLDGSNG